jgi:hypothetical protein
MLQLLLVAARFPILLDKATKEKPHINSIQLELQLQKYEH